MNVKVFNEVIFLFVLLVFWELACLNFNSFSSRTIICLSDAINFSPSIVSPIRVLFDRCDCIFTGKSVFTSQKVLLLFLQWADGRISKTFFTHRCDTLLSWDLFQIQQSLPSLTINNPRGPQKTFGLRFMSLHYYLCSAFIVSFACELWVRFCSPWLTEVNVILTLIGGNLCKVYGNLS